MQLELKEGDQVSVQYSLDGEVFPGEIINLEVSAGTCAITIELENGKIVQIKTYLHMS